MKLYEYQAKELFKSEKIPVPHSRLITSSSEVKVACEEIGLPLVVKSQVLSGGRGKAGLIQFVTTLEKVKLESERLFQHELKIKQLLLEQAVNIEQEFYLSITVDAYHGTALIFASSEGGVDIEELAATRPEAILKEKVDLRYGLMSYQATSLGYGLGLNKEQVKEFSQILKSLYKIFTKMDAELVEINPLFLTKEGNFVAGDGKVMIDDNSMFRHTDFELELEDYSSAAEFDAKQEGIPFIQFDGDIGLMCAGAGLTTTVYDLINYEGGKVANYLEFGGPNYRKAVKSMEICLKVPSKVILVVTFGTIARADVMAEGIVNAINELKPDRPIITCIRGTNEEEADRILRTAGLNPLYDTEEAVREAVRISQGGAR